MACRFRQKNSTFTLDYYPTPSYSNTDCKRHLNATTSAHKSRSLAKTPDLAFQSVSTHYKNQYNR